MVKLANMHFYLYLCVRIRLITALMKRLALLLIFVQQVVVLCAQQRITGIVLADGDVPIIGARYQLQGGRVCRHIL